MPEKNRGWVQNNWWKLLLLFLMVTGWVWQAAQATKEIEDLGLYKLDKSVFEVHAEVITNRTSSIENSVACLISDQKKDRELLIVTNTLMKELLKKL